VELSHGLEWVAATGLVATLIAPQLTLWWVAALVFVALSFFIVLLLSVVASATARLQIDTTVRFTGNARLSSRYWPLRPRFS